MPCKWVRMPDGSTGLLTYARAPRVRCKVAGCREWGEVLCDHPTGKGSRTCSRRLCRAHQTRTAEGLDLCPDHAPDEAQARELTRRLAIVVGRVERLEGEQRAARLLVIVRGLLGRVAALEARAA